MNCSLPQRSCSADRGSWSGDFPLHDWHPLYHWDTSCAISTESDGHFVTRFSISSSNWIAAKSRQNPPYIWRFSVSRRLIWWQCHLDFKKPVVTLSVLLCKIRSDFWTTKTSQKLHEVPKWRVFWRIENKKRPKIFLEPFTGSYFLLP